MTKVLTDASRLLFVRRASHTASRGWTAPSRATRRPVLLDRCCAWPKSQAPGGSPRDHLYRDHLYPKQRRWTHLGAHAGANGNTVPMMPGTGGRRSVGATTVRRRRPRARKWQPTADPVSAVRANRAARAPRTARPVVFAPRGDESPVAFVTSSLRRRGAARTDRIARMWPRAYETVTHVGVRVVRERTSACAPPGQEPAGVRRESGTLVR